jgi:hypothetical protein
MRLDFKMAWAHHVCRSICYLPIAAEAGLFQELDGFADTAELGTIVIARCFGIGGASILIAPTRQFGSVGGMSFRYCQPDTVG